MKQLFILFGLTAISLSSQAQQQANNNLQRTGDRFGVSVFTNFRSIQLEQRADKGVQAKLAAQFPKWYIATDKWTGGFRDLNGPGISVSGKSLSDKATSLMQQQLAVVGIKPNEWVLEGQHTSSNGFQYLYYVQVVDGKQVAFSRMHFRFNPAGQIVRIFMNAYGQPDLSVTPVITADKALDIAQLELGAATITNKVVEDNLEWFPIPSTKGYTLHPAYKFTIEGTVQESNSIPLYLKGYVDAVTSELLYRDNETKDATNLKIKDSIFTNGFTNPKTLVGMPYVTVKIGATTLLANDTGFVSSTAFTIPTIDTVFLKGAWSTIRSATSTNKTPYAYLTVNKLDSTYIFPTTTTLGVASSSRHVNAYYHVNTVHDFMKKMYGTSFTGMDYSLATNVDVTGTCNAYYTAAGGSSINFYPLGGGCVSFAEIHDVIFHEYGHAIAGKIYAAGMTNGALNEGQADVWGLSITKDSVLARGYLVGSPSSYIRRYDIGYKVYPRDIVGEVHADGEIIAGAWWDYGQNKGSVDSMATLFSHTLLNYKPDGPNGTEGQVYFDFLISALIEDDNDADLSNGTPNLVPLARAFAKHGIYLLQDADIVHTELAHQAKGVPIPVNASLTVTHPYFFQSLYLVYRTSRLAGTLWDTIKMTNTGSYNFTCTIPPLNKGLIVDYYFATKDVINVQGVYFPYNYYPVSMYAENTVNLYHQFGVGITPKDTIDFETALPSSWQLGISTDNATLGKWIQAVPVAAYNNGLMSQTGTDHTSGTGKCLVTGNAAATATAYTASVRGSTTTSLSNTTTVLTPFFDLTNFSNPIIEFYRWYGNGRGNYPKNSSWRAQISSGSPVIYRDIDYTSQSDYQWRRRMFKPRETYSSADSIQLKFIATEAHPSGSTTYQLVEAAVDDIIIYDEVTSGAGVQEVKTALAKIYPNPAFNTLNVVLGSANYNELSIRFYDMSGKLVSTLPITIGATHYAIDTRNMASGQYMLVIKMDKTIQSSTVTIQGQ